MGDATHPTSKNAFQRGGCSKPGAGVGELQELKGRTVRLAEGEGAGGMGGIWQRVGHGRSFSGFAAEGADVQRARGQGASPSNRF